MIYVLTLIGILTFLYGVRVSVLVCVAIAVYLLLQTYSAAVDPSVSFLYALGYVTIRFIGLLACVAVVGMVRKRFL